jgi:Major intrinsic protein/UPF0225 domain
VHYNPAVSLAAYLRGRLSGQDLGPYWLAQAAGALVAAGLATFVVNPAPFPALDMSGRAIGAGLVAEFIFTFALAYVVLNTATSKDQPMNSFYGLAIGFTVFVGATAVGDADYLLRTWHPSRRPRTLTLDPALRWTRLAVLETRDGGLFDATGTVQFRAMYVQQGQRGVLTETSRFVRHDRHWTYLGPID